LVIELWLRGYIRGIYPHPWPCKASTESFRNHRPLELGKHAGGEYLGAVKQAAESHLCALLARDDAEAVVLDLVQPGIAARRLRRFGREAGRDEAARHRHGR
jgi:hypothetical protein